jgi:hypothetical protein
MNVSAGSGGTVLFDFVYGISQIRASLSDATLTIPRQVLHIEHSTGPADGVSTGMGTLGSSMVSFTLMVEQTGTTGDGGTMATYTVMGTKSN